MTCVISGIFLYWMVALKPIVRKETKNEKKNFQKWLSEGFLQCHFPQTIYINGFFQSFLFSSLCWQWSARVLHQNFVLLHQEYFAFNFIENVIGRWSFKWVINFLHCFKITQRLTMLSLIYDILEFIWRISYQNLMNSINQRLPLPMRVQFHFLGSHFWMLLTRPYFQINSTQFGWIIVWTALSVKMFKNTLKSL